MKQDSVGDEEKREKRGSLLLASIGPSRASRASQVAQTAKASSMLTLLCPIVDFLVRDSPLTRQVSILNPDSVVS